MGYSTLAWDSMEPPPARRRSSLTVDFLVLRAMSQIYLYSIAKTQSWYSTPVTENTVNYYLRHYSSIGRI